MKKPILFLVLLLGSNNLFAQGNLALNPHLPNVANETVLRLAQFSFAGISDDGLLAIDWRTEKGESGRYSIDPETLEHSDKVAVIQPKSPEDLHKKISSNPDLSVRTAFDTGGTENDAYRYVLKWEAAHGGFGQHAPDVIPDGPLSPLYLIKIK
jgi:hypothetical protein